MVFTRRQAYGKPNSATDSDDNQVTTTDTEVTSQTDKATITIKSGPMAGITRTRRRPKKQHSYCQTGDLAAKLPRRNARVGRWQRCDRCRLVNGACDRDISGCAACRKLRINCTVTNLRSGTTWIRGDTKVPGHVRAEHQELLNHIKDLADQGEELKKQLKYGTKAQAQYNLHQELGALRSENERHRSLSGSTSGEARLDTRLITTKEGRMLMARPIPRDAPFASQQLDIGENPFAPPPHANDNVGANPATLPTWAQPAMSMPRMNAFTGPTTPPTTSQTGASQNPTRQYNYPDLHINPALLEHGTQGQEPLSPEFHNYVYGDKQATNDVDNNTSDITYLKPMSADDNIVDDDSLFDVIMWDQ
ncbi:hypothetical protein BJX64DRAFT_282580 [Aspergillus heterothallicus]